MLERVADVAAWRENGELQDLVVGGPEGAVEWIDRAAAVARHRAVQDTARFHRQVDAAGAKPPGGAEQRDVELDCLAGALAMEQSRGNAAGDIHPAGRIAHRWNALHERAADLGRRQRETDAAAHPEGTAVETTALAFRALVAKGAASRVDDLGI